MKTLFLIACLSGSVRADLLDHIRKVESGGNNRAVGRHGERGAWQISRAAWSDVSRERRRVGLRVYPFGYAFRESVAREYAAGYVELLRARLGCYGHSDDAVLIAWNRGVRKALASGMDKGVQPLATRRFL